MIWFNVIMFSLNMGFHIEYKKVVDVKMEVNPGLMTSMVFGDEKIYYTALADSKIHVFDLNGKNYPPIGTDGSGPNEFRSPESLYFSAPFLFVSDVGNQRLYRIDVTKNSFEGTWRLPPSMEIGVQGDRIYSIPIGRSVTFGASEMRLKTPPERDIINDLPVVTTFPANPTKTRCQGMGYGGLLIDSQGNFWYTITGTYRIEKYDKNGTLTKTIFEEPLGFQEPQPFLRNNRYNRNALEKQYASFDKLDALYEYRDMIILYRFKILTDAWLDIYERDGKSLGSVRISPTVMQPFSVHNGKFYGWIELEDDSEYDIRIVEIQLHKNE